MTSSDKNKYSISTLWAGFTRGMRLLVSKSGSLLSRIARPVALLKRKIAGWPRILQICSVYLLVLLLAGTIYLWQSARLRTINPYVENLKFSDPDDDYLPGQEERNGGEEKETETAWAAPAEPAPEREIPAPSFVWPVKGKEIYRDYNACHSEELARPVQGSSFFFYQGLAIKAEAGENVYPVSAGRVLRINDPGKPYYGKEVIIEHDGSLKVYYGALEEVYVKEGQQVSCGEPIATVKQNPEDAVTYLYLEAKERGILINPLSILPHP